MRYLLERARYIREAAEKAARENNDYCTCPVDPKAIDQDMISEVLGSTLTVHMVCGKVLKPKQKKAK